MNLLAELRHRFRGPLTDLGGDGDPWLAMIQPSQDAKFGDYQANCAMPLGNRLGKPPREIAEKIVAAIDVDDLCEPPEIAGPGFINLRLRPEWICEQLQLLMQADRLGVDPVQNSKTYVIDFSSPNVAKPMHVGHIRSTVIGDALCHTLRFLGHHVISDNHLGDWGTQFGMIIYGFKHFRSEEEFRRSPIDELSRLYKLVRRVIDYHEAQSKLLPVTEQITVQQDQIDEIATNGNAPTDKKLKKKLRLMREKIKDLKDQQQQHQQQIASVESDSEMLEMTQTHAGIGAAVLEETAKLHTGDEENLGLWQQFLPECQADIQRIYDRLDIRFDFQHGESFYHDRLPEVVSSLEGKGLAQASEGATCVFLDGFDTPMIIRKRDGAFLYATTDLATIAYRMKLWKPDSILYVVDHRQSEHFDKLFAAARKWGFEDVEFQHVSFGTVLGEDGRPFKTRSGDTVGLESLLDEAESKAFEALRDNNLASDFDNIQRRHIANVIGIAALKYADLSHNRTSDYVFSYDKMLSLRGNTATYCQYAYARTQSIFSRSGIDIAKLQATESNIQITQPAEHALAIQLLRFPEALASVAEDYRPNHLTNYLFELANRFSTFFEECPVLKAESVQLKHSRLLLCELIGRVLKQGLALLGIQVVERM